MIKKSDNDSHQRGRGEAGALVLGFGGATRAAAVRVAEPGRVQRRVGAARRPRPQPDGREPRRAHTQALRKHPRWHHL